MDRGDLLRMIQNAFGEEKTGGEFAVVAGGAHGDGHVVQAIFIAHADLQGLFDGDEVLFAYCGLSGLATGATAFFSGLATEATQPGATIVSTELTDWYRGYGSPHEIQCTLLVVGWI